MEHGSLHIDNRIQDMNLRIETMVKEIGESLSRDDLDDALSKSTHLLAIECRRVFITAKAQCDGDPPSCINASLGSTSLCFSLKNLINALQKGDLEFAHQMHCQIMDYDIG